jgi:hypothetical protein
VTTAVAGAIGGSFVPSPLNPLFSGTPPTPLAVVSLSQFLAAGADFQGEYLRAAGVALGTTADGRGAYGRQFADGSVTRTFILATDNRTVLAVDQLTQTAYERLAGSDRQLALSTGAVQAQPVADDFAAQTDAFRVAYLLANGGPIGSSVPAPQGLIFAESGGQRIVILDTASTGTIDVGRLTVAGYFALSADDRALARASGGLLLRPTAYELRGLTTAQQIEYVRDFGSTLGSAAGVPVRGVLVPDGGQTAFIESASGGVIDVGALRADGFHALGADDRARVLATGLLKLNPSAAEFRALSPEAQARHLDLFGVVVGRTLGGSDVIGLLLRDGGTSSAFVRTATGVLDVGVAAPTATAFQALPAADAALAMASGALPFLPSAEAFAAWPPAEQLAFLRANALSLGIPAGGTGAVEGLTFGSPRGAKTYILSGLDRLLDPAKVTFSAYHAVTLGVPDLTADERAAIRALAGGVPDPVTAGELSDLAVPLQVRLDWLAANGQTLATLPDGRKAIGVVLPDADGRRVTTLLSAAGTSLIAFDTLTPSGFLALSAIDRALVVATGGYRPSLADFNALGLADQLLFVATAGTLRFVAPDGTTRSGLIVTDGTADRLLIANASETGIIDTGALTFTSFYFLSEAGQSLVLASGGYVPTPTLAEFVAAPSSVKARHIGLVGTIVGTLSDGTAVRGIEISDGIARSFYISNAAGTGAIDILALSLSQIGSSSMLQADRDRVFASAAFAVWPSAAQLRADTNLVKTYQVTLGLDDAGLPIYGLAVADGNGTPAVFIVETGGAVREVSALTSAQFDALTPAQRNRIRAIDRYVTVPQLQPYLRNANERDPYDTVDDEPGELIRTREAGELYELMFLDGETRKLPDNPLTGLSTTDAAFLSTFLTAHSAHQLEYIKANGETLTATDPDSGASRTTKVLELLVGVDRLSYMVSADGMSVVTVATLSLGDVSKLSQLDQRFLAQTDAYVQVAAALGLSTDKSSLLSLVATLRSQVPTLPGDDASVFTSQLDNIVERLNASSIFSPAALQTALSTIQQRMNRVKAFNDVLSRYANLGSDNERISAAYKVGLDWEKLKEGYDDFMREERRIMVNDNRITRLARLARLGIPTMDMPRMIVEAQTLYEISARARADSDTAEIKQQNAMLSDYTEYQRIISKTAASFPDTDQKTAIKIQDEDIDPRVSNMFEKRVGIVPHPIEVLTNTTRPSQYTQTLDLNFTENPAGDGEQIAYSFYYDIILGTFGVTEPSTTDPNVPPGFRSISQLDDLIENHGHGGQIAINNYLKFLANRYNQIDRVPDDYDGEGSAFVDQINAWIDARVTDTDRNASNAERAAFHGGVLGVTEGVFNQSEFGALQSYWNGEVNDFDNFDVEWKFSQTYMRWLEKNDKNDDDWNGTQSFFPDWIEKNYFENNDAKNVGITFVYLANNPNTYDALKRKVDWDNFGTQLTNAITNINQSNQIRQNAISQTTSQAGRHFDLVNNTLRRLNDILGTIARGVV